MKVKEILEKMDSFTDDEAKRFLGGLWSKVSEISKQSFLNFQNEWDGSKTFEEFKKARNKVLKSRIECEILINDVKENLGQEVFTLETEIN